MLTNNQIIALGHELFTPYNVRAIHATSIGLSVGDGLLLENSLFNGPGYGGTKKFRLPGMVHSIAWKVLDLIKADNTAYRPWNLEPGCLVLVTTKEVLNLPLDMSGRVLTTDMARMNGYSIVEQLVPAGHFGPLTLVVSNHTRRTTLPLFPDLHLAELVLEQLAGVPAPQQQDIAEGTTQDILLLPEGPSI